MGEGRGLYCERHHGTLLFILIASVISYPPRGDRLVSSSPRVAEAVLGTVARLSIETLMGISSIVIGLVAYVWVVKPMGHFSAPPGGIAVCR